MILAHTVRGEGQEMVFCSEPLCALRTPMDRFTGLQSYDDGGTSSMWSMTRYAERRAEPHLMAAPRGTEPQLIGPPALIMTVHDPGRRLLRSLEEHGGALAAYAGVYAFATFNTDARVIEAMRVAGVQVELGPSGVAGAGQRQVLATAVEGGHEEMFCCDFDRWLHWAGSYPMELAGLADRMSRDHADAWYICLGRSDRALDTHPVAQSLPEAITNRALSVMAGRRLDATAGAAWIRPPAVRLILEGSTAASKATDLEWPGLVLGAHPARVQGAFLEGLEFETADAYPDEIARLGSREAWIRETYDRPDVLRDRLQLAADSITALMRVTSDA